LIIFAQQLLLQLS